MNDEVEDHTGSIHLDRIRDWIKTNLKRPDLIGLPLVVLSLLFVILLFSSPFLAEEGTLDLGDEGSVGKEDHDDAISNINNTIAGSIYRFGDRYCHQKDHRSWALNGNQMPVCARDVGLFIGIFMGCVFGALYRRGIKIFFLLLLIVPMAIDGGLQSLTSYESFNLLRLLTGMIGGFGVGTYVNGSIVQTIRLLTYRAKKG
jgi:uncharacterized membrane protein